MSPPKMIFRYARSHSQERRLRRWTAALALVLLAGWGAWFVLARVGVYEVSRTGRLEVERASHAVDAPVAGRILESRLVLGQEVEEGAILVRLDAETFTLQRGTEEARLGALAPQIAALRRELAEDARVMKGVNRIGEVSVDEARARQRAQDALARLTETESRQVAALRSSEHVAAIESERSRTDAERRGAEAQAAAIEVGRLSVQRDVTRGERRARLARLENELAELEGQRTQSEARLRELEREIALRTIRAPISGRVGDLKPLRPGAFVEAGERLGIVVPSGRVRAIAHFDQAALGRVRAGQPARLRMQGFPWTKWGVVRGTVTRVGTEAQDGLVRVEITIVPQAASRIPLEHGLPGMAEVVVERLSPLALVLDAAGRYLQSQATAAPVKESAAPERSGSSR